MPSKHPNTQRIGGPGASHENAKHPEKSRDPGPHPSELKSTRNSGVSGGGGEPDSHHTRNPRMKGDRAGR
ncbi:MAG: hypothetical protein AB7O56_12160 [Bauldia sp.]